MSVETVDLSIIQGDSFSIRIEIKDGNGVPDDLTGYGVRGHVKNKYADTAALLDLSPTISNATSGQVDINVLSSVTKDLPVTEAVYDVEKYLLSDTADITKIIKGKMLINPEVTVES
tara:strand:+ start:767 stop:1117 length:351 start_codon:yes stop_codon:yes gene_type:complete